MYLRIQDLTLPGKAATYSPRGGGWASVEKMQNELITRKGTRWLHNDPRYFNLYVYDRIPNGLLAWKFSDAKGHWVQDQQITLEESNDL